MLPLPEDALTLHKEADNVAATAICARLIAENPSHDGAYRLLGIIALQEGNNKDAVKAFKKAIEIDDKVMGAYNNLALAYENLGEHEQAKETFEVVAKHDTENAEAQFNVALACKKIGNPKELEKALRATLALDPQHFKASFMLADLAHNEGYYEEARTLYEACRAMEPDNKQVRYNHGLQQLRDGDFIEGFKGYEYRWDHEKDFLDHDTPEFAKTVPQWDGSPLNGKRILVHVEQGYGDSIQFARFLPRVHELGGRIKLMHNGDNLLSLLRQFSFVEEWIGPLDTPEDFDTHVPLMSLAYTFGVTENTLPGTVPYIQAEDEKIQAGKKHIKHDGLKVGVVWAGSTDHDNDWYRSLTSGDILPLFDLKDGVQFYSLQYKRDEDFIKKLTKEQSNIHNLAPHIADFADTAGMVQHVDIVISVDTAMAHLAGAMGKATFLMVPHVPEWRWMLDREDSPWYPTMRIFRQAEMGVWDDVVENVRKAVKEKI